MTHPTKQQKLYWVIERGSPAEYLEKITLGGADYWTSDPHKALRFPDRESAQSYVDATILGVFEEIRICDHVFISEAQ